MRKWESSEVEVPPREDRPDPVGFLKHLLLALGVFAIFGKPLRALWNRVARRIFRK